jgi:hypothetical protein
VEEAGEFAEHGEDERLVDEQGAKDPEQDVVQQALATLPAPQEPRVHHREQDEECRGLGTDPEIEFHVAAGLDHERQSEGRAGMRSLSRGHPSSGRDNVARLSAAHHVQREVVEARVHDAEEQSHRLGALVAHGEPEPERRRREAEVRRPVAQRAEPFARPEDLVEGLVAARVLQHFAWPHHDAGGLRVSAVT